jgi:hypothetical protein
MPPKADMFSIEINVCFVPQADIHRRLALLVLDDLWCCYEPIVATERKRAVLTRMERIFPVTVSLALDRMSLELLPALTSTGPGSTSAYGTSSRPSTRNLRTTGVPIRITSLS